MDRQWVAKEFKNYRPWLQHNAILHDIFEGNLLEYVLKDLEAQLNPKAFNQIKHRALPVNVLRRVIDKISKIYSETPTRKVEGGKEADDKAVEYWVKQMGVNSTMSEVSSFYNLFKWSCVEPYLHNGKPKLRSIPSDRFLFLSDDKVDPTSPTHFLKIMGHTENHKAILFVYTKDEFQIMNEDGDIIKPLMDAYQNEGKNEFGALPAIYLNRSKHAVIPKPDSDTLAMTKAIPVLLTDLNFAIMYQSFSIIYGIDIDLENIQMSPNAIWSLKSDPTAPDKTPQVGSIKPTVDISETTKFIMEAFSLWMETKNVRASVNQTENMASGFSKVIDEMDTSKERQSQIPVFVKAENELFKLIANNMIPVWSKDPSFDVEMLLPQNINVEAEFPEQKPDVSEAIKIDNAIKKLRSKLTTLNFAIREANPELTEEQIEEILEEHQGEESDDQDPTEDGDLSDQENNGESKEEPVIPRG
jgi:hypothetical protein